MLLAFMQEAHVRHQKDMDALQFRLTKLQQEFESQLNVCDQLNTENQNKALELKVCVHCGTKNEAVSTHVSSPKRPWKVAHKHVCCLSLSSSNLV